MRVLKHLLPGLLLILLTGGLLLTLDYFRRREESGRANAPVKVKKLALFQYASRPVLEEGAAGVIEGLREKGWVEGRNLEIVRFNAESDLPTANSMARAIVEGGFDCAVSLSTPCLQVLASANAGGKVVHVFGVVTDPFNSGVAGLNRERPDKHPKHLVGFGTFQPVRETIRLAAKMNPGLRRVGTVYCPQEACSLACVALARDECAKLGIQLIEAQADGSSAVSEAATAVIARGAEAIWIGGDNTVELAMGAIVEAARRGRVPVFANAPSHAKDGAFVALGADYVEVGRAVGRLASEVLAGADVAGVPIGKAVPLELAMNADGLSSYAPAWKVPEDVLAQAVTLYGPGGKLVRQKVVPGARTAAAVAKPRLIRFLSYLESPTTEDFRRGFFDELGKLGLRSGRDYAAVEQCAQGDFAALRQMADAARDARPDLIVAVSTQTLQCVIQREQQIPVVFGVVGSPIEAGAGKSETDHLPNVTGVDTDADWDGMLALVKTCIPGAKAVGTLYAPSESNSVYFHKKLEQAAKRAGLTFVSKSSTTASDVPESALALTQSRVDAICQISDNLHNAAFPAIAKAARQSRVPLFAFASPHVKDGNAAAGLARDYEQNGRDAARLAKRIFDGESPKGIPFQATSRTLLMVNPKAAAECGLTLPPEVLRKADLIVP